MAFRIKIEGQEPFDIPPECTKSVKFTTEIPLDSDARTKDVGTGLIITGKILAATDGDPDDSTRKMALWSVVPAEKADCYRKVTIELTAAGVVERKYHFPNAFVVDYKEKYGDVDGTGTFTLALRQKKDKFANVTVEGGYPA
ncbi:membrane-associated protease 1 [Sporomusa sphaeroides]|uniref:membrane-associated protease 1 n=1 Tax=Sporomusa sphaeroides TaxID=47679 RepID=UPI002BE366EA|nr:membrane-associated protease 1 [Sporomusa sphaeroides]HML32142.1 membrane-associated protease 1 [Sporomusa sphaeroides]